MLDLQRLSSAELATLIRALHEARFPGSENDPLVWSAPFVADLHSAAIDEDRRRLEELGDQEGLRHLETWLRWAGRPERAVVVRRLREDASLGALARQEGAPFLRRLLRPFVLEDEDVEYLIEAMSEVS